MRYGVIADIHGNLHALEAATGLLARAGVDRYLCAGDIVGYGPFPNECVERVAGLNAVCVAGNHDLMAIDRLSEADCIPLAQETIRWTRTVLRQEVRGFLAELPPRSSTNGVAIAHGSLEDSTYYVTEAGQAERELELLRTRVPEAEILILGHTHRPYVFERAARRLRAPRAASIMLAAQQGPFVLNPGSVGQSRERRAWARCMLLDLRRREVSFFAVDYDYDGCRRALQERGLPPDACHLPPSASQSARRFLKARRDALRARAR